MGCGEEGGVEGGGQVVAGVGGPDGGEVIDAGDGLGGYGLVVRGREGEGKGEGDGRVESGEGRGEEKGTNLLIILNPLLHTAKVIDFQWWQFRFHSLELRNESVVAEAEDAVDLGELAEEFYRFLSAQTFHFHVRLYREAEVGLPESNSVSIAGPIVIAAVLPFVPLTTFRISISTAPPSLSNYSSALLPVSSPSYHNREHYHNTYSPATASDSSQYTHHTAS